MRRRGHGPGGACTLRAPEGAGGGTGKMPHAHAFLAEERTNAPTLALGLEGPGKAWKGLEGTVMVGKLEVLLNKERGSMLMTETHSL